MAVRRLQRCFLLLIGLYGTSSAFELSSRLVRRDQRLSTALLALFVVVVASLDKVLGWLHGGTHSVTQLKAQCLYCEGHKHIPTVVGVLGEHTLRHGLHRLNGRRQHVVTRLFPRQPRVNELPACVLLHGCGGTRTSNNSRDSTVNSIREQPSQHRNDRDPSPVTSPRDIAASVLRSFNCVCPTHHGFDVDASEARVGEQRRQLVDSNSTRDAAAQRREIV